MSDPATVEPTLPAEDSLPGPAELEQLATAALDPAAREAAGRAPASEPLTDEFEHTLLSDLVLLSVERAEAEERIAREFTAATTQLESDFAAARAELRERRERETDEARTGVEEARRRILTDSGKKLAGAEQEYAQVQEQLQKEFAGGTRRAQREHKEARWEADTVFDATKHGPGKRLAAVRRTVESIKASLDAIEADTAAMLARWRQQQPSTQPAAEPSAAGETLSALVELVKLAESERVQISQLRLPRLFEGMRLVGAFVAIFLLLLGPLWWFSGIHALWIAPLAAAVITAAAGTWLYRLARAQVETAYPPLAQTLHDARELAKRIMASAKAQYRREKTEIAERLARDLRAADERYERLSQEITERRNRSFEEATSHYPPVLEEIAMDREMALSAASLEHDRRASERELAHEAQKDAIETDYHRQSDAVRASHAGARAELIAHWRSETRRLSELVDSIHQRETQLFPDWPQLVDRRVPLADRSPPGVPFGQLEISLADIPGGISSDPELSAITPERFALPALLPLSNPSLLIKTRSGGRARSAETLQAVMLRLLTSLPPGKVRFTIIDPVGRGENFAAFMHLADYDEALITSRIWTEPGHIKQRLTDLSEHMENVIQKYLRNEFESIEQYNAYAGEIAEPFRFVVVANFPAGFSDEAARRLLSIMGSGARCGVSTLMSVDMDARLPGDIRLRDLEQSSSTVLVQKKQRAIWKHKLFGHFPLSLEPPPAAEDFTRILHTVGIQAKEANRVEVPFEFIAPPGDQLWTSDSRRGIDVPLGRAGAMRLQHLKLGHGTSQHVLIAGQTGSGKSTLLHALITNLALRYSPEQVELYLIDFKKGVEFKTYATHELPHARVIAIESDREFGLSVLERLDAELKGRADQFRELGVSDIAGYRQTAPDTPLPRILLIVDEFQELFVEDDKISQASALLLDRLVRQGRAFGMHLLLGSQTLGGAYGLARSTMGQIGVRIALRCSEVDAHLIMSEENSAARLLSRAGEAIYNDANGTIEGNHPFQVVWLGEETREKYLTDIQHKARQVPNDKPPRQVVFEGNAPAQLEHHIGLNDILRGDVATTAGGALEAWLGESVLIKDPTAAVFRPQSGNNLLVIGQNDEAALGVTAATLVSLLAQLPRSEKPDATTAARCFLLDGSPSGSAESDAFGQLAALAPTRVELVGFRQLGPLLDRLATEVDRRSKATSELPEPIFLFVYALHRFRDLRKAEDDYSFSRTSGDRPPSPAVQLATILREGPSLGVHTTIWCDSLNNLNRALDRQTLREFEMRVVFQMSSGDSSTLIDTPIAGKLGPYRALYVSEERGLLEKFRPYRFPSAEWLASAAEGLAARR